MEREREIYSIFWMVLVDIIVFIRGSFIKMLLVWVFFAL